MEEYRWAIVSFFDILGFKNLVKTNNCDQLHKILKIFQRFSIPQDRLSKDVQQTREMSIINFSDSIVRIFPIDNKSNLGYPEGMVFHELLDLIHIQGELAAKDIIIRGAVTMGEVFCQGNICYGPGFIKAYGMETEKAKYPRLIVDPDLVQAILEIPLLKASHHDAKYEHEQVKKLLRKDNDGWFFTDYLRVMEDEADDLESYLLLLRAHKKIITRGLCSTDPEILKKHRWLKEYHNRLIRSLNIQTCKQFGVERNKMLC